MMRCVFAGLLTFGIAGCASVALAPAPVTATLMLTEEQSALRSSANAFCDDAEDKGWVQTQSGFDALHRAFFQSQASFAAPDTTYADTLETSRDTRLAQGQALLTDIAAATNALDAVNTEAETLLTSDASAARSDIASFERALVFAQKARRAFLEGGERVGIDQSAQAGLLRDRMDGFDLEIDRARRLADRLAEVVMADNPAVTS